MTFRTPPTISSTAANMALPSPLTSSIANSSSDCGFLRGSAGGGRGRERLLKLARVLVGQRGPDDGSAVLLERGDRLVGGRLLDDHEQRRCARLQVVAHLLLEGLVDPLLAEVAEQCAEAGAERQSGERNEEQHSEQQPPEAAPDRASPSGRAAVGRVDVVFAFEIAGD